MDSKMNGLECRFLIVGFGSIGKRHLLNLRELGAAHICVFDVREERRQAAQQLGVMTFEDLASAFRDAQVALICTPTRFHLEHALAAARGNCDLFIEKPLADTTDGLNELLQEVRKRGLVTLVGCNFRFHPGLVHVKRLLQDRAVGTRISARAQFGQYLPDWHPWEDYRQGYSARQSLGGGVVLDRIHEFDSLQWLLGPVAGVYAALGHQSHLETDTEDVAEVILRFTDGTLGSVHLDYVRRTYDCSLEIVGEEGTIQWWFQKNKVNWYLANDGAWHSIEWPGYQVNDMYLAELRHFLACLERQERPMVDVEMAKEVLEIALACKKSTISRTEIAL